MKSSCAICGVMSKSKFKIEARKGTYYPICSYCFSRYETTPMKEIRRLIKKSVVPEGLK